MSVCECGCGVKASTGKRFISGHNGRGRRKPVVTITCKHCQKDFDVRPHLKDRVYCSSNCRDDFRRARTGSSHPNYTRSAVPCEMCGKNVAVTPYTLRRRGRRVFCSTECGKASHRQALQGKPKTMNRRGPKAARIRDGSQCVLCGFEHATAVHHIQSVKDGGTNDLSNLVTLCPNHHYMAHAGLVSDDALTEHAKPFSFHNGVPILAADVPSSGPKFRQ